MSLVKVGNLDKAKVMREFVHFALMQNEPKDQGWDSEAKNFPCPLKLLNYAGLLDLTSLLPSFCPRSDTEVSLRGP